jgi:serine/threonine protein kinase
LSNLIGHSIGRYHILEQLGEGGMATVYKAYDTRLERDVAVKIIRIDQFPPAALEKVLKRFEREAKSLAKLTHPNIVHINDFGEHEGVPYLVMDYLPGGTLKERMSLPMTWQAATRLLIPVASALEYAHENKIIHRDVKPANILLTKKGQPMVTDFGIAKLLETESGQTLTGTGVGIGTPEYMAPEQGMGRPVDRRADIYSLGVVFYELVTAHKPYTADTPMAVVFKHISDPLPDPRQFMPDLPESVARVLFKALAKEPEDRYASMEDFAAAIEGLSSDQEKSPAQMPAQRTQAPPMKIGDLPTEAELAVIPVSEPIHAQTPRPDGADNLASMGMAPENLFANSLGLEKPSSLPTKPNSNDKETSDDFIVNTPTSYGLEDGHIIQSGSDQKIEHPEITRAETLNSKYQAIQNKPGIMKYWPIGIIVVVIGLVSGMFSWINNGGFRPVSLTNINLPAENADSPAALVVPTSTPFAHAAELETLTITPAIVVPSETPFITPTSTVAPTRAFPVDWVLYFVKDGKLGTVKALNLSTNEQVSLEKQCENPPVWLPEKNQFVLCGGPEIYTFENGKYSNQNAFSKQLSNVISNNFGTLLYLESSQIFASNGIGQQTKIGAIPFDKILENTTSRGCWDDPSKPREYYDIFASIVTTEYYAMKFLSVFGKAETVLYELKSWKERIWTCKTARVDSWPLTNKLYIQDTLSNSSNVVGCSGFLYWAGDGKTFLCKNGAFTLSGKSATIPYPELSTYEISNSGWSYALNKMAFLSKGNVYIFDPTQNWTLAISGRVTGHIQKGKESRSRN